jgi:hypothetical protein
MVVFGAIVRFIIINDLWDIKRVEKGLWMIFRCIFLKLEQRFFIEDKIILKL